MFVRHNHDVLCKPLLCVCVCVCAQLLRRVQLFVTPMDCIPTRLLCPWDFPARVLEQVVIPSSGNLLDPGNEPTSPASVTERCQVLSFQMQEVEWVGNSPGSKPSHRSTRHSVQASSGGQTITQERQAQCGASSGGSLSSAPVRSAPVSAGAW